MLVAASTSVQPQHCNNTPTHPRPTNLIVASPPCCFRPQAHRAYRGHKPSPPSAAVPQSLTAQQGLSAELFDREACGRCRRKEKKRLPPRPPRRWCLRGAMKRLLRLVSVVNSPVVGSCCCCCCCCRLRFETAHIGGGLEF